MKRKAIQLANQTIVISLPSKWVKQQGIKKGDDIDVEERGNELAIGNKIPNKKNDTETNLTNDSEITIRVIITNLYRSGFDKIKINFNKEKQFDILKKIIKNRLIGFDIIIKEKDYCIVENITEPSENQFDNIFKKLFLNIEGLFELTRKKLNGEIGDIEDFEDTEERIHKYDNFCRRVISKRKFIINNSEMFWSFLVKIINAQRELYHVNKFLEKNKMFKSSKEIRELMDDCILFFNILRESLFQKKIESLGKIHELEPFIVSNKIYPSFERNNKKENVLIFHLGMCIRQLHLSVSPLVGYLL